VRPGRAVVIGVVIAGVVAAWAAQAWSARPPEEGPAATPSAKGAASLRFVALGDSYTIGTGTGDPSERWPDQLVAREGGLDLIANLAVNGFTSRDVIDVELPKLAALEPDFVSLLIGVNDVVQDVPEATYARNVALILDDLLERLPADRIVTVATPDYTVTPQGSEYGDPVAKSAGIRRFNDVLRGLAESRGIVFVDIHGISLEAEADRSLVARDGLHPSGAQYARWVERIAPAVAELLGG
jgi:acyl-CoA thioesterase I